MRSFRFRAQRVLDLRRTQADAARAAVVLARERLRTAEASLQAHQERREHARNRFAGTLLGAVTVMDISQHRAWLARLDAEVSDSRRAAERSRSETEAAVNAFAEAARRVKVLERLRERTWRRHVEAERLEQTRTLDEFATLAYARRREGERARGH